MVTASGTSVLGDQSLLAAVTPVQLGRISIHFSQAQTVAPYRVGRLFLARYRTSISNRAYVVQQVNIFTPGIDFEPIGVGMDTTDSRLRFWADWYLAGLAWNVDSDS